MDRRIFLATVAKAGIAGATLGGMSSLAGCGGGGGGGNRGSQTITTNGTGRAQDVFVAPDPGGINTVPVPPATDFQIQWPDQNPPRQFNVALHRFREPIGGQPLDTGTQPVQISQVNAFTWNVQRRDNFDLDLGGVYYLEVSGPGSTPSYTAYIVSKNRSRAVTVNPGTNGFLSDVDIFPRPGSCFIPKNTDFAVAWTGAAPPPAEFTVRLQRYKEPRGSDEGGDNEQQIDFARQGNDFVWALGRRDNFDLDGYGVYYIEISSPGQGVYRAPYIVGNI